MVTTRIIHVLSNGPSLATRSPPDDGHCRIGINLAAKTVPEVDWWCFGDQIVWQKALAAQVPPPAVGYVCAQHAANIPHPYKNRLIMLWEWLWMPEDLGYSANIGIWAAATFRAEEIHLWGFDHAGMNYADGSEVKSNGSTVPDRWEREKVFFDRACQLVTERGFRIVRH